MTGDAETDPAQDSHKEPDVENDRAARFDQLVERADGLGNRLGAIATEMVLWPVLLTVRVMKSMLHGGSRVFTRIIPKAEALWAGLAKTALENTRKSAGGDIIGIIGTANNELAIKPMKYKTFEDEPGEPSYWVTKGGERWGTGAEGRGWQYIGSTPVGLFNESASQRGSFLQANYAEALELDQKDQVVVGGKVQQNVTIEPVDGDFDGGVEQAIADGGYRKLGESWEVEAPGMLQDVLVDLSPNGDAEGMRVSTFKYDQVFHEKVDSEEMQMQEARGRAAEADPEQQRQQMFTILKYILGGVLLARSPELLAILMGNSGIDGIGSVNPFWVIPPIPGLF